MMAVLDMIMVTILAINRESKQTQILLVLPPIASRVLAQTQFVL